MNNNKRNNKKATPKIKKKADRIKKQISHKINKKINKTKDFKKEKKKNKKDKKENKKIFSINFYFWLIIIAIVVMIFFLINNILIQNNLKNSKTVEHYEYNLDLIVDEKAAFNLDKDKIHFGRLPPNSYSSRDIVLTVPKLPARIESYISGNISNFIEVLPDEEMILIDNQNQTITLKAYIPYNTSFGKYEGALNINITTYN